MLRAEQRQDERAFSIREVVNAASNVVTTAATGDIQTWATNGELGYSGDGGLATLYR